jgi:hypothetical protein
MSKIERRTVLRAMVAAVTGTAAAAISGQAAYADFSPPVHGRRYQKYGGHNFIPISSLKNGLRTDWTYNDNGSVYASGSPTQFNARLQLPDGALVEEVQFNYFLGNVPAMQFSLIAFDNANGYQTPIPTAFAESPDPTRIQTISLDGLPIQVDNAAWNYVLRWAPHAADSDHMLWGARVGYRRSDGGE